MNNLNNIIKNFDSLWIKANKNNTDKKHKPILIIETNGKIKTLKAIEDRSALSWHLKVLAYFGLGAASLKNVAEFLSEQKWDFNQYPGSGEGIGRIDSNIIKRNRNSLFQHIHLPFLQTRIDACFHSVIFKKEIEFGKFNVTKFEWPKITNKDDTYKLIIQLDYLKKIGIDILYMPHEIPVEYMLELIAENQMIQSIDQELKFEMLQLCMEKYPFKTGSLISCFRISDQSRLEGFAKKYAGSRHSYESIAILNNLGQLGLKDENAMVEIIKIAADKHLEETINNFQNYGLKDENLIAETYVSFLKKMPTLTIQNFYNFGLKDEKIIYDLAKLSAMADGEAAIKTFFEKNELKLPNEIFEMAKICAKIDAGYKIRVKKEIIEKESKEWIFKHVLTPPLLGSLTYLDKFINQVPFLTCNIRKKLFMEFEVKEERKKYKERILLMRILFAQMAQYFDKKLLNEMFNIFTTTKFIKDRKNFIKILNALSGLTYKQVFTISIPQKEQILQSIIAQKEMKKIYKEMTSLDILLDLDFEYNCHSKESFTKILQKEFKKIVPTGDVKDFEQKMEQTFLSSRIPGALFQYAGKLKGLNNPTAMKTIASFIKNVFDGTFIKQRNSKENNPHLKIVFDNKADLEELWQKPLEHKWIKNHSKEEDVSFANLLKNWVQNGHLGNIKNYTLIDKYLNEEIYLNTILEQKPENEIEKLQIAVLCLCKKTFNIDTQILKQIKKQLESNSELQKLEFYKDISGLIKTLSTQKNDNLYIVETVDPYDLLLCGTEVDGSCQKVDEDCSFNCGLLGYIMDGKIRMLAVKDKREKIIARALLKILWDGKKPVLFLEQRYPKALPSSQEEAIRSMAKEKAEMLGLELYESGGTIRLDSFGGPAPFEYVDACKGIRDNGKYFIEDAKRIE